METSEKIIISSESDFISFVSNMLSVKNIESDEFVFPDIEFIGWPTLNIVVQGEPQRYKSSLTASMLFGMADLTEEIYRAFAVFRYSTSNLTNLTESDKKALDIVYYVTEGSSRARGQADRIINGAIRFLNNAVKKMNGIQALGMVVALTTCASTVGWHWLSEYYETQRHDNTTKVDLVNAATQSVVNGQKVIVDALIHGQTKESKEILLRGEEGKARLVKKLSADDSVQQVELGSHIINRAELNAMNIRQRIDRVRDDKTAAFFINGLNWSGAANQDLSVSVINSSTGETLTLKTTEATILPNELLALSSSLTTRDEVKIRYLEVKENGKITVSQFTSIELSN
ncbi:hypothetical protein KKI90_15965 [Xenorhabdus bovienii]|uniref:hypothetical protein n=1 Tax=Xenorhabdus bovienii TaxID=40576 RepID=UPI00237C8090|nr:hypothetical protein [Xenorhabdus bovienii]MDE1487780.1 hypothetical protein [Xenorhabdus bovienii]MDE9478677.1 hypothetical protein [Xenorhabdus bovienii]MDE9531513.1 hypothetical protein [Xenorhabdus bovienii]